MTDPAAPEVKHGRRVFRNTLITGVVGVLSLLLNFFVVAYAIRGSALIRTGCGCLPFRSRCRPAT